MSVRSQMAPPGAKKKLGKGGRENQRIGERSETRIPDHSTTSRFCMHNSGAEKYCRFDKGRWNAAWQTQPLTSVPLSHQVLVPTAGIRGFLDASDYGTWLKYIREAKADDDVGRSNVRHFLLAGQIYYETTRDIDAGEELLLGPKASEG